MSNYSGYKWKILNRITDEYVLKTIRPGCSITYYQKSDFTRINLRK